jgi:hypothetical protein
MNRTSVKKWLTAASIDDHQAREDWGWKHEFDLEYDG